VAWWRTLAGAIYRDPAEVAVGRRPALTGKSTFGAGLACDQVAEKEIARTEIF
jgi:hypothetical protein